MCFAVPRPPRFFASLPMNWASKDWTGCSSPGGTPGAGVNPLFRRAPRVNSWCRPATARLQKINLCVPAGGFPKCSLAIRTFNSPTVKVTGTEVV